MAVAAPSGLGVCRSQPARAMPKLKSCIAMAVPTKVQAVKVMSPKECAMRVGAGCWVRNEQR